MFKLPQNQIWKQYNRGDKFGDLWSSYNLDLTSKIGVLKISPRMLLNANTTDLTNMTKPPCAFRYFTTTGNNIYTIAYQRLFSTSDGGPNDTFAEVSGTPTSLSSDTGDLEIFPTVGKLYISGANDDLFTIDSGANIATLTDKLANSSGLHQMVYFRALNRLYIVDDNAAGITSLNTSNTSVLSTSGNQYSLNDLVEGTGLVAGSRISWIEANSNRIFIGTINQSGFQSSVYAWDGSQVSGPNEEYTLDAAGSFACVIKDDMPVIIDSRGRLMQLNGGTFTEIDRLPFEKDSPLNFNTNATETPVHYNGMVNDEDDILVLVNTILYDTNSTNAERVPSGIWRWNKETGFHHSASLGLTKSGGTITDYGGQKLSLVGALHKIELTIGGNITKGSVNGRLLAGASYYTNATTTTSGIFYDDSADTLQKAGGFTTSKIFSPNISEIWQKMCLRFRKLLTATDKIVVKYRTAEEASSEITITWTSTTEFTTTTNIVGKEGYEIEILNGVGAGKCAHLSTTGYNATNYIATVDETFTGATGTAKARIQNWEKLGSNATQTEDFKEFGIDIGSSTWIQFKVWILSTGKNEINDLILINAPNKKAI